MALTRLRDNQTSCFNLQDMKKEHSFKLMARAVSAVITLYHCPLDT